MNPVAYSKTPSSLAGIVNKMAATSLAGASPDIIRQLPDEDRRPYALLGYCNLVLTIIATISVFNIVRIFISRDIILLTVVTVCTVGISLTFLKYATKGIIDKMNKSANDFFIIVAIFISVVSIAGFSLFIPNNAREIITKEKTVVYDSLVRLKSDALIVDGSIKSILSYKTGILPYEIRRFSGRVSDSINNLISICTQFNNVAKDFTQVTGLKDTAFINSQIRPFSYKVESLNYFFSQARNDSGAIVSQAFANEIIKLAITESDLNRVISLYNPGSFSLLTVDNKINILFQFAGVLFYLSLIISSVIIVAIFRLIMSTSRSKQGDFYHELLKEKIRLDSEFLQEQRKKIAEDYRLRTELKNTQSGLKEQIENVDEIDRQEIQDYSSGLSGTLTPASLCKASELAFRHKDSTKALEYINKAIELEDDLAKNNTDYRLTAEIYELKADILRSLNLTEDAEIFSRKGRDVRNENSFLDNKSKKIKLDKIVLEGTSIFDNFTWAFQPGINILLGRNGYGKSHLLGLIIALLYDDKTKIKDWIQTSGNTSLYLNGEVPGKELEEQLLQLAKELKSKQIALENEIDLFVQSSGKDISDNDLDKIFEKQNAEIDELNNKIIALQSRIIQFRPSISADPNTLKTLTGRVPVLAIPDTRFIDKSVEAIRNLPSEFSDLAKYGGHEFLYSLPYSQVIANALFKLSLSYIENNKRFTEEPFGLIHRVIRELSFDKLVNRDGQMVYQDDSNFKFVSIDADDKNASFSIKVQPEDSNIILPIQKVSQGTFSIISICCLIYNYLKVLPQQEKEVLLRSGIVIIDELDAHIHPSWQRKLILIFRKNFPNVQFIISSHNPLMIEACKSNEVSVLRRTEKGKFNLGTIQKSLLGDSIENIYSAIFEVEERNTELLRYKELSPYLESFKKELSQLREKESMDTLNIEETNRLVELQDLVAHIAQATSAFSRMQSTKEENTKNISDFLKLASEADLKSN